MPRSTLLKSVLDQPIVRRWSSVRDVVRFDIEEHEERTSDPYLTAIIGTSAKLGLAFEEAEPGIFPRNFIRRAAPIPKNWRLRSPYEYL